MRIKKLALRVVCLAGMVMLALGAGCASDQMVVDQANQMHGGLRPAVINDAELNGYLSRIGNRIIDAAQALHQQRVGPDAHFKEDAGWMFSNRMQFHFVNSDALNAFTTGGEHMYIYRKLFQTCETEDELVAVMAHEYAHVYGRHVHKGMNRQMAMMGGAAAMGAAGYAAGGKEKGMEYAGYAAAATMLVGQFALKGFTRSDESEADKLGFEFYVRGGWDPKLFGAFFKRMVALGYDKGPEMLSDHPSLKSRADNADRWARELSPQLAALRASPVAPPAQFRALQARIAQVSRGMPTDQQLQAQKLLTALPRSCLTPAIHEDQKEAQQQIQQDVETMEKERQQKPAKKPKPAK